jgi:hypothetical protein
MLAFTDLRELLALYQHLNHEPQSSHNVLWQHELHDETFALWQMA